MSEKLKCISLWQPWAQWVALGWKTIETRLHPRLASLKGQKIGICASKKWDPNWRAAALASVPFEKGGFLTDERLQWTDLAEAERGPGGMLLATVRVDEHRILTGADSVRAMINCGCIERWGLVLTDTRPIVPAVPVKGRQGIFTIDYEPGPCGSAEKCPLDCGHSDEEHLAFDLGVESGRAYGSDAENPYRFFVPCLCCGHNQVLAWERIVSGGGYQCAVCQRIIDQADAPKMVRLGSWRRELADAWEVGHSVGAQDL